jgi:putative sigma-54 modulation protein
MRIAFTFHNLESTEAIKTYATEKIGRLQKYMQSPMDAAVTFSLEKHTQRIDVSIHVGSESFHGSEEQENMYASIDLVVDKIRNQLRRTKDEQTHRRRDLTAAGVGK